MAVKKGSLQQTMERLKLKREELDIRVRQDENKRKLAEVKAKLSSMGGRVR